MLDLIDWLIEVGLLYYYACCLIFPLNIGPNIVVKFELYELYFWLELYERKMKWNKVHKVQKVKMLYYASKLWQKVTTLNNFRVPQSRTLLKCTATLRLIDNIEQIGQSDANIEWSSDEDLDWLWP